MHSKPKGFKVKNKKHNAWEPTEHREVDELQGRIAAMKIDLPPKAINALAWLCYRYRIMSKPENRVETLVKNHTMKKLLEKERKLLCELIQTYHAIEYQFEHRVNDYNESVRQSLYSYYDSRGQKVEFMEKGIIFAEHRRRDNEFMQEINKFKTNSTSCGYSLYSMMREFRFSRPAKKGQGTSATIYRRQNILFVMGEVFQEVGLAEVGNKSQTAEMVRDLLYAVGCKIERTDPKRIRSDDDKATIRTTIRNADPPEAVLDRN